MRVLQVGGQEGGRPWRYARAAPWQMGTVAAARSRMVVLHQSGACCKMYNFRLPRLNMIFESMVAAIAQ